MSTPGLPTLSNSVLLQQIESNLTRTRLRFSPDLEKRFESDTGAARARMFVVAGLVSLCIYDAFLFGDYMLRQANFFEILLLRLGVMTLAGLFSLLLIYRGVSARCREGLMACLVVLAMATSGQIFHITTSPVEMFDPFSFDLILLAGNIVIALRFKYAVAATVAGLLVMAGYVLSSDSLGVDAQLFSMVLATATAVFTLVANFRIEVTDRRAYLFLLREQLRADAMREDNLTLTQISQTDPLTQLANRRRFEQVYEVTWRDAAAAGDEVGLLMIDIDHFKSYNDTFGHQMGDVCLQRVAAIIGKQVRKQDLVARLGGEEFVVLLPGTDLPTARRVAERVRTAIEGLGIPHAAASGQSSVTVSIGAAVARPLGELTSADLMRQADEALYAAKRGGRNRCHVATA